MTKIEYLETRAYLMQIIDSKISILNETSISYKIGFATSVILISCSNHPIGVGVGTFWLVVVAYYFLKPYFSPEEHDGVHVSDEIDAMKKLQEFFEQGKTLEEFYNLPEGKMLLELPKDLME
jgi:hypothetical protein